jgi:small subunit ribosomal protein S8
MSTTSTDPISDMLTRIRNAAAVRKTEVRMPHSNIKEAVAKLLKENNFLNEVKVDKAEDSGFKELIVTISGPNSMHNFTEIERLSKPGRRLYAAAVDIPIVKRGRGIVIVSTSQGLMTGDSAKKKRLGGELICKVY